jgi:protein AATF/BFR2
MGRREYIESLVNNQTYNNEENLDEDFDDEITKIEQEKYKSFPAKKIDSIQKEMQKYKSKKVNWDKKENDNFGEESLEDEFDISREDENISDDQNDQVDTKENYQEEEFEFDKDNLDKQDEEYLKKISNFTPNEIKKGKNVTNQKNLFEFFINIRISLQKIIIQINSLPKGSILLNYIDDSNPDVVRLTLQDLLGLLYNFVAFQKEIIVKNNYFEASSYSINILSEVEEILHTISEYKKDLVDANIPKVSLVEEILNLLHPFTEKLISISEKIINIWYRKTQVYSYKSSTGNKLMKILSNNFCEHLKTNLKNNYESLRKKTMKKTFESQEEEFDESIYNDSEFYNYLLKEFISNKEEFEGVDNSSSRMDLTLQYLLNRNKQKSAKGCDTKASKNRKIRFDKHEKLINFMVPLTNHMMNPGRQEIIKSIFGGSKKSKDLVNSEDIEDIDLI